MQKDPWAHWLLGGGRKMRLVDLAAAQAAPAVAVPKAAQAVAAAVAAAAAPKAAQAVAAAAAPKAA